MAKGESTGLGAWIARSALDGEAETALLAGLCERLNAAGVRIMRAAIAGNLLDPVYDSRGLRWARGAGGSEESFARESDPAANEDWARSPFFRMIGDGAEFLRRRTGDARARGEFPVVDELAARGATDYIAFLTRAGPDGWHREIEGMLSSWTTDAPEGFTDAQIDLVAAMLPTLALAFTLRTTRQIAGPRVVDAHLALHVGDLLYGNVGSPRRLDFTVLGPAVNEAARIEALCGSLDQTVVVSWAFAEAAGAARSRLVSLGRYALKGVSRPQEMFTLDVG